MHLKTLALTLFRGFSNFSTDSFAPFTIIGGRNNTGKTSLLEAVFYLSNRFVGFVPGHLMLSRKMSLQKRDLSPLFYNLNVDTLMIHSEFSDGSKRDLTLETAPRPMIALQLAKAKDVDDISETAASPFFEQHWSTLFSNGEKASGISEFYFTQKEYKVQDIEFKSQTPEGEKMARRDRWKCHYYHTRNLVSMRFVYKELFRRKNEQTLVNVLQFIDNRIVGIVFDGDQVLVDVGIKDLRIPIEIMGDGTVKVADILALAAIAKSGDVICIDEIENGLHHSVMGPFVKALAKMAEERGIQVIATTHNLELMQSAAEQAAKSFRDNFAYINLARRKDGTIVPTPFNHDEFSTNLENEIDIR